MIGNDSCLSAVMGVQKGIQNKKVASVWCMVLTLLAGMWAAPAWCATQAGSDTPGVVQKKLSSSPDKLLVQWQTAKGASLRALVDVPARPRAAVILFAGDNGCLGLTENGEQASLQGNFLARSRDLFVKEGLIAVLVDVPSSVSGQSASGYRTSADQAQEQPREEEQDQGVAGDGEDCLGAHCGVAGLQRQANAQTAAQIADPQGREVAEAWAAVGLADPFGNLVLSLVQAGEGLGFPGVRCVAGGGRGKDDQTDLQGRLARHEAGGHGCVVRGAVPWLAWATNCARLPSATR